MWLLYFFFKKSNWKFMLNLSIISFLQLPTSICLSFLGLFQLIWLIVGKRKMDITPVTKQICKIFSICIIKGSFWIYSVQKRVSFDPDNYNVYCESTCFYFMFWSVTASWILIGVGCCCGCIFGAQLVFRQTN